ncbi:hypothetical protein EST38_g11057 [Candolleomyces aberdarensis]|uniref:Uncharacterized protein n=1 Tax=Candolleomyces aberdarensis TaxID=2316362 RepID=A0A4Q2D8L1_9AGAR|nr:hypothetical protein EST38_g11057 [Candolleomyces aberdarensis]
MTDYSAQGKTRDWNVVDITECNSFQGAYTCLSRGTSLRGTLVLRPFDESLLNGPLDGALRQEYRELNYLDAITQLRYDGKLPDQIVQKTRGTTIAAYRAWKKSNEEDAWHPKIRNELFADVTPAVDLPPFKNPLKRKNAQIDQHGVKKKRKVGAPKNLPVRLMWQAPAGPAWDGSDYSCAYDVWTTILYSIWDSYGITKEVESLSPAMEAMVGGFAALTPGSIEEGSDLTQVRNRWRQTLRLTHHDEYPVGVEGADMVTLSRHLLGMELKFGDAEVECSTCRVRLVRSDLRHKLLGLYNVVTDDKSIDNNVKQMFEPVGICPQCPGKLLVVHELRDLMCYEVMGQDITLSPAIDVGLREYYRLAGIIYYGTFHFVSRIITKAAKIYYHDGMDGTSAVFDGVLNDSYDLSALNKCNGRSASIAIYIRAV